MIKLNERYDSWKETPFSIFYDGEKHTLSKYTKDQFSDHPKMVLPQYNRNTDTLYYIGIIDGDDVGEKFMNSGEAMDYLDNYYTYGYHESIKRNRRITEAKYILRMNGANGNLSDEFEFDSIKDAVKYASKCDIYNYYFISDESGNVIKRGRCNTMKESQRNKRIAETIIDTVDDEDIVDDLYSDLTDLAETMLTKLQEEINDIKYDVEHARNIDGEKAYYGIRNAKQSLDNVSVYLSYIRNAIK